MEAFWFHEAPFVDPWHSLLSSWSHILEVLAYAQSLCVFPTFFFNSFRISDLTFRSLIHLELIFVHGKRDPDSSLVCRYPGCLEPSVGEAAFSPLGTLDPFLSDEEDSPFLNLLSVSCHFLIKCHLVILR